MNNMDKKNVDEIWEKAILRGKDVKEMLRELSDKIELMQEDYDDLVESYRKLKDEKFKDEEIKRLKEELDFYQRNTLVTLSVALWTYWHTTSFVDGLLVVVNAGGDADTNAAVACAVLGAKYGYSSIPNEYIEGLLYKESLDKTIDNLLNICIK